jgi:hypothetical protein
MPARQEFVLGPLLARYALVVRGRDDDRGAR